MTHAPFPQNRSRDVAQTLALLPVGADVDEGVLSAAFLALTQAVFAALEGV